MSGDDGNGLDKPAGGGRWLKIALVVSLGLNLAVAGIVTGAALGGRDGSRPDRDFARTPFMSAVPREHRGPLAGALRAEGERFGENRRLLRARFEEILDVLRADSFDRVRLEALLRDQRDAALSRQDLSERVLLDYLESLPVSERRAYADRLDRSLRRRP